MRELVLQVLRVHLNTEDCFNRWDKDTTLSKQNESEESTSIEANTKAKKILP